MKPVRRVVVASDNPGKLKELQALVGDSFELVPQGELGVSGATETGTSFEQNALLKARHAAAETGLPAIADDSGLEVRELGGAPGVYSARYAGDQADDEANNPRLLAELRSVPPERRKARFRCVMAFVRNAVDPHPVLVEGIWDGAIATAPRGHNGFGYDPLFIDLDTGLHSAELEPARKNRRSHRGKAVQALKERLQRI